MSKRTTDKKTQIKSRQKQDGLKWQLQYSRKEDGETTSQGRKISDE